MRQLPQQPTRRSAGDVSTARPAPRGEFSIAEQARFWNADLARIREVSIGPVSQRQAEVVLGWVRSLERVEMDILDVGCGSGWFSGLLVPFGRVTAIDITDELLERARLRTPQVEFVTHDFMTLDLSDECADLVVMLEVLSHVSGQSAFLAKVARLLRPGGHLMLATQNRPVLERCDVRPVAHGQIRKWVDARALRHLLEGANLEVMRLMSVYPDGHHGFLRLVNSRKLNRPIAAVVSQARLDKLKERVGLGHTLMALARRPLGTA